MEARTEIRGSVMTIWLVGEEVHYEASETLDCHRMEDEDYLDYVSLYLWTTMVRRRIWEVTNKTA